jgi:hypothetical protein
VDELSERRINNMNIPNMTLLDYFAGQALAGFLANPEAKRWTTDEVAADAYAFAYSMLEKKDEAEENIN